MFLSVLDVIKGSSDVSDDRAPNDINEKFFELLHWSAIQAVDETEVLDVLVENSTDAFEDGVGIIERSFLCGQ